MTDVKMDATVPAAEKLSGQSGLGRAIKRVGTHNFSLLIALGILATAQTIVIISGGLDISVGAVVGLTTVCIALAVRWTDSPSLSICSASSSRPSPASSTA